MIENAEVLELQEACVRSFRRYFREANRTCKLLASLKMFPITLDQRLALAQQRQKEIYAYQSYRCVRGKFLELASDVPAAVPPSMVPGSSLSGSLRL